jgi:hypothetical protein
MATYLTDTDYLRDCRNRGRTPSAYDYDEYRSEMAEYEPDDWEEEEDE